MTHYLVPGPAYNVQKLVPKLRFQVKNRHLKFRQPEGPFGRLVLLRKTVTALFKYERIELNHPRAAEARGYAERLITEAIHNGDCHRPTMEMADFWLEEKQLIHKLFKVLVPRFQDSKTTFTSIHSLPALVDYHNFKRVVFELKGNPYPPVVVHTNPCKFQLHNVLLNEAKKEYRGEKSFLANEKRFLEDLEFQNGTRKEKLTEDEELLIDGFKKLSTKASIMKETEK